MGFKDGILYEGITLVMGGGGIRELSSDRSIYRVDGESCTVQQYQYIPPEAMGRVVNSDTMSKDYSAFLYGTEGKYVALVLRPDGKHAHFRVHGHKIESSKSSDNVYELVVSDGENLHVYHNGARKVTIPTQKDLLDEQNGMYRLGKYYEDPSDYYLYDLGYIDTDNPKLLSPKTRSVDDRIEALENLDLRMVQPIESFVVMGLDLLRDFGGKIDQMSEEDMVRVLQNFSYHDDGELYFDRKPSDLLKRLTDTRDREGATESLNIAIGKLENQLGQYPKDITLHAFFEDVLQYAFEHHPERIFDERVSLASQELSVYRVLVGFLRKINPLEMKDLSVEERQVKVDKTTTDIEALMNQVKGSEIEVKVTKVLDKMWRKEAEHRGAGGGNRYMGWKIAYEFLVAKPGDR